MRFIKMHGAGNDFVVLDALAEPMILHRPGLDELARQMCDRNRGVGGDGLIVLLAADDDAAAGPGTGLAMRIYNADGSDGAMCGNGARCAAKFAVDRGYVIPNADGRLLIQIGPRTLEVMVSTDANGQVTTATVDMGAASFALDSIPVDPTHLGAPVCSDPPEFALNGFQIGLASLGNPHAVAFVDEAVEAVDLARHGGAIENSPAFPERISVHAAQVVSPRKVDVRSWERGVGLTQACGSGACAVVALGVRSGRLDNDVLVRMPGGELTVRLDTATGRMLLRGDATEVFLGDWPG